jgi:aminopeptidase YwaD
MARILLLVLVIASLSDLAQADVRDLIDERVLEALASETSGEAAKRNLDTITLQHRMRSGAQFDAATRHIHSRLQDYGLDEVGFLTYAADGETMYGTQKSRPVWDVRFAQLWEVREGEGGLERVRKLADWDSVPLSLAQDSLSGEATALLVDIGAGTSDADYAGKDLEGKLVLTSSQPEVVVDRAVGELDAAGIISYAPNQRSAWWKEDDRLVRWGHIGSFPQTESFAFMISLGEARRLQARLAAGESVLLHANVDASHEAGQYRFATARIEGASKPDEEIHFTCHLDHPRPGANDNASGCMAILETARTLQALIDAEVLPRPARSIRWLWPAEIEGSIMYLVEHDDPSRIKANIHMDMVGGSPVTKAVYRVSGGPMSVPSFVSDLAYEIAAFVNDQTLRFADGETVAFPLNAPEGGKEPLQALMQGIDMGSDHDVFFEGTWRIPGMYLHEWPDRYIHTNFDTAANIDPTKLKRSAFIGAAAAWFLANMSEEDVPEVLDMLRRNAIKRSADVLEFRRNLELLDPAAVSEIFFEHERAKIASIRRFAAVPEANYNYAVGALDQLRSLMLMPVPAIYIPRDETVYVRNPDVPGPMNAFGYSYLEDKLGSKALGELQLPRFSTEHGGGYAMAYEALNFVDGRRTVSDIRDWLVAEFGTIPVAAVAEYLEALESIGVLSRL